MVNPKANAASLFGEKDKADYIHPEMLADKRLENKIWKIIF